MVSSSGCWHKLWVSSSALILLTIDLMALNGSMTQDQISWTPIYVDTTNRLDLWTIKSRGCECPDGMSTNCACCVKPGGCLCSFNQNKCAQCGFEDEANCQRFCNVTISSRVIATRSGLTWVQIKSPELEGPISCWWRLHSAPGQRIEVQIHRLVAVGHFNNDSLTCSGGYLQFSDGEVYSSSKQAIQLCAQNSRYSPPVVLFGDQGTATLLIRTESKTTRSTLLAYVSFSSRDDPIVGVLNRGGKLRPRSACDWTYENCFDDQCVLSSPGYPGLFPPHRKCRYFLNANVTTDKIRVHFNWLSFPSPPLCATHHVAIWRRNVSNLQQSWRNPWKTLCQESEISLEIDGGVGLIEFRSANTISPYVYTGFRAIVQFIHTGLLVPTPEPSNSDIWAGGAHKDRDVSATTGSKYPRRQFPLPLTTTKPVPQSFLNKYDEEEEDEDDIDDDGYVNGVLQVSCGHIFEGSISRGTVFRLIIPKDLTVSSSTRLMGGSYAQQQQGGGILNRPHLPPGPFKCQLEFHGRPSDVVQLAVFNYKFRGSGCSAFMEVYDMVVEEDEEVTNQTDRLLGPKLCGPSGNGVVKRYTSSHSRMALVTLVLPYENLPYGTEFLDGAFLFHDESIEGTVKPMSSGCEVVYYGVTSLQTGTVVGPPDSPLLRLSTFPLVCAYSFLPGVNQSISLTLTQAGHETSSVALPGSKKYCRSFCGPSGCKCEYKHTALKEIDHLLIVAENTPISCLCGYFPDALPMTFESQSALTLVYHATQGGTEFSYASSFQFKRKILCSNFTVRLPSGSKRWREALGPGVASFLNSREFQQYTYFECAWIVFIPQRYNLTIDFISEENEKDCNAWNLTLWAGKEETNKNDYRNVIGSFCPRYGRQEVKVPENIMDAYIKLTGVSLRPPQFEIRWKYYDVLLPGLTENRMSGGGGIPSSFKHPDSFVLHLMTVITLCATWVLINSV